MWVWIPMPLSDRTNNSKQIHTRLSSHLASLPLSWQAFTLCRGCVHLTRLIQSDWTQTSKTKGTGEIQSDFIQRMKQDVETTEQNGVENHWVESSGTMWQRCWNTLHNGWLMRGINWRVVCSLVGVFLEAPRQLFKPIKARNQPRLISVLSELNTHWWCYCATKHPQGSLENVKRSRLVHVHKNSTKKKAKIWAKAALLSDIWPNIQSFEWVVQVALQKQKHKQISGFVCSWHGAHGALRAAGVTGAAAGLHDGVSAIGFRWVQLQVSVLQAVLQSVLVVGLGR